jgi:hypothetical protein
MTPIDTKILDLIDILKTLGIIEYAKDFCEAIGMPKQSITRIRQGKAHFTAQHIANICKVYNINPFWIFDTQKNVFNSTEIQLNKAVNL